MSIDDESEPIRLEVDGAIAHLVLHRPAKLNALDRATLEGLAEAAATLDKRDEVKVVIIRGAGRAFTAGFDLNDQRWAELGPPERSAAVGRAMAEAVTGMQAITIASVHGHCVGGGVVLAAACDLRVAAAGAMFRIPEVDLGMPLYWAGIPLLVRELGPALTNELVLTGRSFDADEALRLRFVNQVVPDARLEAVTSELASTLASKSALVLRTTKQQVAAVAAPIPAASGTAEDDVVGFGASLADPESREAAAAYLERTFGPRGS